MQLLINNSILMLETSEEPKFIVLRKQLIVWHLWSNLTGVVSCKNLGIVAEEYRFCGDPLFTRSVIEIKGG